MQRNQVSNLIKSKAMKATINKDYVLVMGENVRISSVDKDLTIFRAKKGVCDRELIEAASDGTVEKLCDSLGEWQILVKTDLIEWED